MSSGVSLSRVLRPSYSIESPNPCWAYLSHFQLVHPVRRFRLCHSVPFPDLCMSNPKHDDPPIGTCPKPDIASPLVRIANYVTAFCLTILIFHAPKRVKGGFYYQIFTIYALLIACSASLIRADITPLYASISIPMAFPPVLAYFLVYSIRAFRGEHRLSEVLGKKDYINRGMVFFAVGIWVTIVAYISLGLAKDRFAQGSCQILTTPGAFLNEGFNNVPSTAVVIAVVSWLAPIALAVKICLSKDRREPKFATVWEAIEQQYPFVFFMSVGIAPMGLWIWTIELSLFRNAAAVLSPQFSLSSGEILALSIAVPPLLQVFQLVPQLWSWGCRGKHRGEFNHKPDPPSEAFDSTGSGGPTLPEGKSY